MMSLSSMIVRWVSGLGLALAVSAGANAAILTFDDVPGGSKAGTYGHMPGPFGVAPDYHGFVFNRTLDWIDVSGPTWPFGARSGKFALINNYTGVGIVTAVGGATFTFDGLWAKTWSTLPESGGPPRVFGTLQGWANGSQVWTVDTVLNGSYMFFAGRNDPIDELRLGFGNYFLADDLALNERTDSGIVPVPATAVLLLSALAAGGLLRRRCTT